MLLLNNEPVNYFKFPGGEYQVRLPAEQLPESCIITWLPKDADSIILLLLTVNALKNHGVYDITLECIYLPYARQDRVCLTGEPFSLEMICQLLDPLGLTMIKLWDVHNEENTLELFNNTSVFNIEVSDIFKHFRLADQFDMDSIKICSPDSGGYSRAHGVDCYLNSAGFMCLDKIRNPEDGIITGLEFNINYSLPEGDSVLVIDDICDGGKTFIEAAKLLKANGANNLYLYVTHGIFSKGLTELLEHYKHIFCHHVFSPHLNNHDRLTVLRKFDEQ
jgi:ribose-phosphate pyrophosphokinase